MLHDNAAIRQNYVGMIYQMGVDAEKTKILHSAGQELSELHEDGILHIHDLEAYGKVYNCCTPDLVSYLQFRDYHCKSQTGKMFECFGHIKNLIIELAASQSGGIGFANFDEDVARSMVF